MAPTPVEGLVAALSETFALIISGYVLGINHLMPRGSTKSFNAFLSWIALPAVYFNAMATLDAAGLNGGIILTLIISKAIMMAIGAIITITFAPTDDNFIKRLGIFSLFCSSPNDVAVGLCIAQVLYPEYQIYLFFPIQALIFNPLGCILLEYGNAKEAAQLGDPSKKGIGAVLRAVARRVITNPLVLVNISGLLYNWAFGPQLPLVASRALRAASSTFTGVASFNIGLSMVGKGRYIKGRGVAWPVVLAALKVIFSGVVTYKAAIWLLPTEDRFHEFAFMYGALPVAISPFVFSEEYDAFPVIIAGALVVSMFISAPVMFIMIAFSDDKCATTDFCPLTSSIANYLNAASFLGSWWLLMLRVMVRSFKVGPLSLLAPLGVSAIGYTVAQSACFAVGRACLEESKEFLCSASTHQLWIAVAVLRFFFNIQMYCWPLILLVVMFLWARHGAAYSQQWQGWLTGFAWVYPALFTLAIVILHPSEELGCILVHGFYGTLVMLAACIILLVATTAGLFFSQALDASDDLSEVRQSLQGSPQEYPSPEVPSSSPLRPGESAFSSASVHHTFSNNGFGSGSSSLICIHNYTGQWKEKPMDLEGVRMHDKFRIMMLATFTIFALLAGGLRLVEALLYNEAEQGLFYQPAGIRRIFTLLTVCCSSGFGLFAALTFSFQVQAVVFYRDIARRINRFYEHLVWGPEAEWIVYFREPNPLRVVPLIGEDRVGMLLQDIVQSSLLQTTRSGLRRYKASVRGATLVTWLVRNNWVPDRSTAVILGQQLLRNGLLHHVDLQHDFLDSNYLYQLRPQVLSDRDPPAVTVTSYCTP